ncbi:hypothetical protein ANAEL_04080 [Anaerolineales bacterium]|nr:hypothetical protein ANAEL_04080 [Anaerolineales bacterium]
MGKLGKRVTFWGEFWKSGRKREDDRVQDSVVGAMPLSIQTYQCLVADAQVRLTQIPTEIITNLHYKIYHNN